MRMRGLSSFHIVIDHKVHLLSSIYKSWKAFDMDTALIAGHDLWQRLKVPLFKRFTIELVLIALGCDLAFELFKQDLKISPCTDNLTLFVKNSDLDGEVLIKSRHLEIARGDPHAA